MTRQGSGATAAGRAARRRTSAMLIAALPLAGCISFAAKPPASLLTLTAQSMLPAGSTQTSATSPTITIQVPQVSQALATQRVPVQSGATAIAYVAKALWVEPPARLFARLMSDTIGARTGRVVLSTAQSFNDPGARLSGELRAFGVDATSNEAVVTFDGSLIRIDAHVIEKRRFEARVPVAAITAEAVGPALNQAANTVAIQVADWIGR